MLFRTRRGLCTETADSLHDASSGDPVRYLLRGNAYASGCCRAGRAVLCVQAVWAVDVWASSMVVLI